MNNFFFKKIMIRFYQLRAHIKTSLLENKINKKNISGDELHQCLLLIKTARQLTQDLSLGSAFFLSKKEALDLTINELKNRLK